MIPNRGPATLAVTAMITAISTIFVAGRVYTRTWLVRSFKLDDGWIVVAWVVAVSFSASICVGVHYGLGLHQADIDKANFPSLRKAEYAFSVLYNPSLMLTKTSIIVFYLSVMSKDVDPVFKWCNWLTLAVVNVAGLALTFLNIFQCTPVKSGFLYPTPPTAKCTDIVTLYLSSCPVNIITDLAVLFLPMPILTGMRLPRKQKIILVVTFSFGAFVAVVDVIRIAYLQNASLNRLKVVNGKSSEGTRISTQADFPWSASLSFMWSAVEVHLGIICACVPSLKPLFVRFMPNFIRDTGEAESTKNSIDLSATGSQNAAQLANMPRSASMLTNPAAFRKPIVKEYSGNDDGDEMGFLNMLSGPDEDAPGLGRSPAQLSRMATQRSTTTSEFGFVRMDRTKNMLKLSNRQSVWPIAVVTIIFFLWGFAYGLLDALNSEFQVVVKISQGEVLGLHAAYFGGYAVGPLTLGQFMLKKYGFKESMMAGLCVYGCGTLVFWPSAVLTSYPAFVFSNFIVAFGLSCLEIAANPFMALCGPLEYAETRLNISQAFQAIGTVLSPLLATKVLFKNASHSATSLVDVQWAYLAIALFVIGLAVAFYYIPLPEATDEQLQELADRRSAVYRRRVGPWQVITVTMVLGAFSQWCYVGGQEAIGTYTQPLVQHFQSSSTLNPFDFQTVAHTVFAIGRFLTALLTYFFKPRWILLGLYIGLVITCALQMAVTGTAALVVNQLIYLFESGTFSIIFAITLRGMGSRTKTASAWITAAISGGAVFPLLEWPASNRRGVSYSFCVPLAVFAFGTIYPVYLNVTPAARAQVDPIHDDRNARRAARLARSQSVMSDQETADREYGLKGMIARRKARQAQHHAPTRSENGSAGPSPITMSDPWEKPDLDSPDSPPPIQMRRPSGIVGDLDAWPTEGEQSHVGPSEKDDSDKITGVPPEFTENHEGEEEEEEDDDDDSDDYHKFARGLR